MVAFTARKESKLVNSLKWEQDHLLLLDQTKLPETVIYLKCFNYESVITAIKTMVVRGAPAIGAAAAFAVVLAAQKIVQSPMSQRHRLLVEAAEQIAQARPTAVNLAWAVERMITKASQLESLSATEWLKSLEQEALAIAQEDITVNQQISLHGSALFTEPISLLTHCNAGALATVGIGTALGVVRQLQKENKLIQVYADETRPLLQGARLTSFELQQDGIPVTLITDNMAAWVMKQKKVQAVIVGADRIALNGDVANKIGTYGVALLAKAHDIPFYVAAPLSTFDFSMATGEEIPIEERRAEEVRSFAGSVSAPADINVYNPAFDVTPADLISGIITEVGVLKPPFSNSIAAIKK